MIKPGAVLPGDRIAIVSPASPFSRDELDRGVAELRRLGYEPTYDPTIFETALFTSGTAATRAAAFMRAWSDPAVSRPADRWVHELRSVVGPQTRALVLNSLRSTLVYIEPIIEPATKAIVGWEAWGGGWGHGTGMSQTGAVGMAATGRVYQEILGHYYRGVVLQKRWE